MFCSGFLKLRQVAAVACVALTCFLGVQTAATAVDRFEHALGIEHDADNMAGSVTFCSDTPQLCSPSGDVQQVSHTHSGDTVTVFTVDKTDLPISQRQIETLREKERRVVTGLAHAAPERPPKV